MRDKGGASPTAPDDHDPVARCGQADDDGAPASALALGGFELATLEIMRHFFCSFARPCSQRWEVAFDRASGAFGAEHGPAAALAVLRVLRTMRESRREPFQFNTPECSACAGRLTGSERALIEAVRAMRLGDLARSRSWVSRLCGKDRPIERLCDALIGLSVFAAAAPEFMAPQARARLH